ncbi:MAG: TonB-dependent receptor [Asticcacaulis sp.]
MNRPTLSLRLLALTGTSLLSLGLSATAQAQTAAPAAEPVTEVVVKGQRLSNANAIQAQKKADGIVNVISADDLGKLPDANVADALARVPGVNVVVNQETGEGEYVTVRGLAGTFNAYSINGVRVALTDTESRKMSMTVLPPNGLKAISVSKTLTPDMDGDAIGGTVNFVTPTAFDFNKPTTMRAFVSMQRNDRARAQNENADGYQGQFDYATKFGDAQQFGFYGSFNYGKSQYLNEETENDGEWEPYRWRANSTEAIDGRSMYLPGIDLDYRRGEQIRYGGNFSLDWRSDATQLYLRGQISKFERTGSNDYTDYRSRNSARLVQVNAADQNLLQPDAMITGHDAKKGRVYGYTTAQIVDADKDGIITDADATKGSMWSMVGKSGVWNPKAFQFARTFETQDQVSDLMTINAGGASTFDRLSLAYDLSYSKGSKGSDGNFGVGYNCNGGGSMAASCPTSVFKGTGVLWSSYDPRFPLPQIAGFAADVERRDDYLPFDGAWMDKSEQTDARLAARFDAKYDLDGGLVDFVKAGFKYMKSEREYDSTPIWDGDLVNTGTLDKSGLVDRKVTDFLDGRYYYGSILSRDKVEAAINAARKANPTTYSRERYLRDDKKGQESIYAAYALANIKTGDVEVIAGARVEHTKVETTVWVEDGTKTGFGKTARDYTNVLPSITAIWRPEDRFVVRGALWTSFSRPEYGNISRGESITRDKGTNEIVAISRGNPVLKPAKATNLDLSAEFYPDRTSMLSLTVFRKSIDNFIFTNGNSVEADTKQGSITISQPKNGENATITGVELNLIKSFEGLGAPFDGFGVEFNLTSQNSEAKSGLDYRKNETMSFVGAPDLLYNAALTYQKYGFEGKLAYQYQGAYVEDLRDNAIDKWVQPNKSLDLHTRYNVNSNLVVDFDVQNILDGHRYYTTKGRSPSYQKDYMEPGRTFVLRLAYTY